MNKFVTRWSVLTTNSAFNRTYCIKKCAWSVIIACDVCMIYDIYIENVRDDTAEKSDAKKWIRQSTSRTADEAQVPLLSWGAASQSRTCYLW